MNNDRALDGSVRFGQLTEKEQAKIKFIWRVGGIIQVRGHHDTTFSRGSSHSNLAWVSSLYYRVKPHE